MIYYIVFFSASFLAVLELGSNNKSISNVLPFYVLIAFTVLVSFRTGVGTDFYAYESLYYNSISIYDDGVNSIELGYLYLSKFFALLDMPFYVFLVSVCVIMYTFIYKSVIITTTYPCIALCILYSDVFFYFHLSGIRQAIAMSITMYSFKYILDKRLPYFLFAVTCAALFHKTAIIFVILYPLVNYFSTRVFYLLCLLMLFIMPYILSTVFFNYISSLGYFRAVDMYISDSYNVFSLGNFIAGAIKRSFPLLVLLYLFNINRKESYGLVKSPYIKVWFFGFSFFLSTYYSFPDISVRLSTYFIMFNIIILPMFIGYFKAPLDRGIYVLTIFIYCAFSMYSYTNIAQYQYKFIDIF
ncbi:EpsG family protein [Vibrio tapetis]|uniref:EpsG family protein n=1 Tax=Vibrio tapetis subsp. tapetis TaxID=1671868 RepID=A0A2N8ZGI9_9VIBR|nr:conserved membrane protein of unknown function [Vibrio tapetis subsp. tapetis]